MKKMFLLFITVLMVSSCTKDSPTSIEQKNQAASVKGSLSLSFDKTSVPQGVIAVVMTLERQGFTTLTTSINFPADSTAEATFSDVPIGTWNLKVNALGSSQQVLYTGQCGVTVYEGLVTQVSLVLQQVITGTGGVKIIVFWGGKSDAWSDNTSNPILRKQGTRYDGGGIGYPVVLKDASEYKMWYMNLQSQYDSTGGLTSIGMAVSSDGNSWTHSSSTPVLSPTPGAWDGCVICPGSVIKDNGVYKMYYEGYGVNSTRRQIGLAISSDGIHWQKYPNPVLSGTTGWEYSIGVLGVVKTDSIYFMYYHSASPQSIGVATSTDGINWNRYAGNPVLNPTETWENSGLARASVVYENGVYKMIYQNHDYSSSFGYATSRDGLQWTKDVHNPIFSQEKTSNQWASGWISYGFLAKVAAQERLYYTGTTNNSTDLMVGFAYKQ